MNRQWVRFLRNLKIGFLSVSVFWLSSLVLSSCASSPSEPKEVLQVGMDKAAVIEAMGNPKRTGRKHNMDRWYYDASEKMPATEIFFSEGKVSHFGRPATDGDMNVKGEKGFKPVNDPVEAAPAPAAAPKTTEAQKK